MTKYKYIPFENCCILIMEEYEKIEGREISDKHRVCTDKKVVMRVLLDLRLIRYNELD